MAQQYTNHCLNFYIFVMELVPGSKSELMTKSVGNPVLVAEPIEIEISAGYTDDVQHADYEIPNTASDEYTTEIPQKRIINDVSVRKKESISGGRVEILQLAGGDDTLILEIAEAVYSVEIHCPSNYTELRRKRSMVAAVKSRMGSNSSVAEVDEFSGLSSNRQSSESGSFACFIESSQVKDKLSFSHGSIERSSEWPAKNTSPPFSSRPSLLQCIKTEILNGHPLPVTNGLVQPGNAKRRSLSLLNPKRIDNIEIEFQIGEKNNEDLKVEEKQENPHEKELSKTELDPSPVATRKRSSSLLNPTRHDVYLSAESANLRAKSNDGFDQHRKLSPRNSISKEKKPLLKSILSYFIRKTKEFNSGTNSGNFQQSISLRNDESTSEASKSKQGTVSPEVSPEGPKPDAVVSKPETIVSDLDPYSICMQKLHRLTEIPKENRDASQLVELAETISQLIPDFGRFPLKDRLYFCTDINLKHCMADKMLLKDGSTPVYFYFVVTGQIELYRAHNQCKQVIEHSFPGSIVGDILLDLHGVNAVALLNSAIICINRVNYFKYMMEEENIEIRRAQLDPLCSTFYLKDETDLLGEMARICRIQTYKPGEVLVQAGQSCGYLFWVLEGSCQEIPQRNSPRNPGRFALTAFKKSKIYVKPSEETVDASTVVPKTVNPGQFFPSMPTLGKPLSDLKPENVREEYTAPILKMHWSEPEMIVHKSVAAISEVKIAILSMAGFLSKAPDHVVYSMIQASINDAPTKDFDILPQ
jgi:CRP-like cAMP-binding protein